MSAKEVAQHVGELHAHLTTAVNTLNSHRNLSSEHKSAVRAAAGHLQEAGELHFHASNRASGGIGSNQMDRNMVHGNLRKASNKLSKAHTVLKNSGVMEAIGSHHTVNMPKDEHVADVSARASALQQGAQPKPFKRLAFAGKEFRHDPESNEFVEQGKGEKTINREDVEYLKATQGKSSPGIQKLDRALKGTPKGKSAGIAGKKSLKEGDVRGNRSGVVGGKGVDPRRPASSRRVADRYQGSDYKKFSQNPLMMPGDPTKSQSKGKGLPNVGKKKK